MKGKKFVYPKGPCLECGEELPSGSVILCNNPIYGPFYCPYCNAELATQEKPNAMMNMPTKNKADFLPAQGVQAKVYRDFLTLDVNIEIEGGVDVYCTPINTMPVGIDENGNHIFEQEKVKVTQIFITEEAFIDIARCQKQEDGTGRLIFDITGD